MYDLRRPSTLRPLGSLLLAASALLWAGCSDSPAPTPAGPDVLEQAGEPGIGPVQDLSFVRATARANTPALMAIPGVVGTAVGLNPAGRPTLRVFLARDGVTGVPDRVNGVPVSRVVTGTFVARADRTASARPAPIGFSIGHPDITAGTLGARVTDGTHVYVLSNNHVIAASNAASIGDATLQPGAFDGGSAPADVLGTLADFQPILFGGASNAMDAAIALVDPNDVSGSTPADEGYGAPGTNTTDAILGLLVQKYGRTTGHTTGWVSEIDVTVNVCYAGYFICTSVARFDNQIGIADGTFSDGGDSGSLIVTLGQGNNPVALLFAGSDTRTIASPIGPVLQRFGVQIDPTVPGGGNLPPTAGFTVDCTGLTCSFDGSGSSDDGTIVDFAWDFGDGSPGGSGATADHTFAAEGTYTVTLTVTDDDAATDDASQPVTVSAGGPVNAPPTASFTFDCTDLTCSFDAAGSSDDDGAVTDWAWDFGDGSAPGSGETTGHTYAAAGTYTVTLTVTDDDEATDEDAQSVTVTAPPSGNTAPAVDAFNVSTRRAGPWSRAEVSWSVSDVDGDLTQVTVAIVGPGGLTGEVLDSQTTLLSGGSASGTASLRTRAGNAAFVTLIVSDQNGNITTREVPF